MKEKVAESKAWYVKVLDKLNLTEEGRIQTFGNCVIKDFDKKIRDHKRSIESLENKLNDKMQDLNDELAELELNFEDSFTNIDPERVKTDSLRKEYISDFAQQILDAERKLQEKIDQIESLKESTGKQIEEIEGKIIRLETYLIKLK